MKNEGMKNKKVVESKAEERQKSDNLIL